MHKHMPFLELTGSITAHFHFASLPYCLTRCMFVWFLYDYSTQPTQLEKLSCGME